MIDTIKSLYDQLDHKTNFIILVSDKLKKSPVTLRNHWFGAFWRIPQEYQEKVISLLNETIKNQNQEACQN